MAAQILYRRDIRRLAIQLAGSILARPRFRTGETYAPADVADFTSLAAPGSPLDNAERVAIGTTYIGTPYYSNLVFPSRKYIGRDGVLTPYNGIELIEPVITVSESKRIVETEVAGRDGEFLQYIGRRNPTVSVFAWVIEPSGDRFPEVELAIIRDLMRVPASLPVFGAVMERNLIHELVIRSHKFSETKFVNAFSVEFEATAVTRDMIKLQNDLRAAATSARVAT